MKIILSSILGLFILVNCGSGNAVKTEEKEVTVKTMAKPKDYPKYDKIPDNWDAKKVFIAKSSDSQMIFFVVQGNRRMPRQMAMQRMRMSASGEASQAIKQVIQIQIKHVKKTFPEGKVEKIKNYINQKSSNNVVIRGLRMVKMKNTAGGTMGLFAMDYQIFLNSRNKALEELKKEKDMVSPEEAEKIIANFKKLD